MLKSVLILFWNFVCACVYACSAVVMLCPGTLVRRAITSLDCVVFHSAYLPRDAARRICVCVLGS